MKNYILMTAIGFNLTGMAAVTVVQNVSPGATSWPGTPLIRTIFDPAVASASENFASGFFGSTNLGETFVITTTNYDLQTIDIYAGGGTGTGAGTNVTLNLYDLGSQTAPNPNPYGSSIISSNLLGAGAGLSITYSNQPDGILEFDFSGSDQAYLQSGHMYAFELTGVSRTMPFNWLASTNNPYTSGVAYQNQYWLNYFSSSDDFAMAIYAKVDTNPPPPPPPPVPGQCTVDWNDVHQRIDGFGASSAWDGNWTPAQADMFFSTNNGIGLSFLRSRIAPGGTTVEGSIMQMAQARGARVWSTPWSPQAIFKSNGNVNGGGFVSNPGSYQAYADQLAGYVVTMKNVWGVNLYAISVQNEPDAQVTTYESCNWTAQQIHDFVPYLHDALAASNVASTKIMLPESQNWQDYSNLTVTAMSDPSVAADVSIIADHNYDGTYGPTTLTKNNYGKALWETEVSLLSGSDATINNGIYWAERIHLFLTIAQVNAWHYWWLISGDSTGNEGLTDSSGAPTKRMYVVGQFSRFVRPNYYRIGANNTEGPTLISAYKDSVSPAFAIVAINTNTTTATAETINLANFNADSVTPWITSATLSLAQQPAIGVTNSVITYELPAMSVVTFVGQNSIYTNLPSVLTPVADQTINADATLTVTNVATDPDLPLQTLTFDLLNGPTNATLDTARGIFNWRPLISQANTTNLISIKVSDNGTPNLSATNNFKVIVNPVVPPVLNSVTLSQGQISFAVNGNAGPNYTLLTSTNLVDWQPLFTTNSPMPPFTFTDTNLNGGMRFYKIQLGP